MLPEEADAIVDEKLDSLFNDPKPEEPPQEEPEVTAEEPQEEGEPEETKDPEKDKDSEDEPEEEPQEAKESAIALDQIAAALGVDENDIDVTDDGKVVFKTKVDGVEGRASLAEIRKSYQLEGHLNRQNMEVVNERKAIQTEREEFTKEHQAKIQQLDDIMSLAVAEYNRDFQSIDWDGLRQADPSQFLLKRQEFQDRQNSLNQSYQYLQETRQAEQEQYKKSLESRLQDETAKLRSSIPGWDDDVNFEKGKSEMKKTLTDYGFNKDEISSVHDHRLLKIVHDAMQFKKLQSAKPEVEKRIKALPKVVKAGTSHQKDTILTTRKNALQEIKKSGGAKGVDAYLDTIL